jgi:OmpR family response regulator RpaB
MAVERRATGAAADSAGARLRRPSGFGAVCSTKEFQLPQLLQRPKNCRVWAPQLWQTKIEAGRDTSNYEESWLSVKKRDLRPLICSQYLYEISSDMTATAASKETILVVDDEDSIRRILETRLSMIGYNVVTACDGTEALESFEQCNPDLVVLDVMMPKLDGYGVCQELRKESDVPIVMLTALGDVADRITGLELGADDYVVKPFSPKELEARIRCVLRRVEKEQVAGIPNSGVIQVADLRIDTNKRQVFRADERIRLTGMEFSLLELLVGRSGEPFSRGEILKDVWGYTPERHVDTRVVDVHISRLRSKLEDDPANPELILTARGTGYLFQRIIDSVAPEGS